MLEARRFKQKERYVKLRRGEWGFYILFAG